MKMNAKLRLAKFDERLLHLAQDIVCRTCPNCLVHNLAFNRTRITRSIDSLTKAPQLDHTRTHHAPPRENSGQRNRPIGNMERENPAGALPDLLVNISVPPDVEHVERDPDHVCIELLSDFESLIGQTNHTAIRSEHWMQWLNPQLDPASFRVIDDRRDAIDHHAASRVNIPIRRRPANQHQRRSSERS